MAESFAPELVERDGEIAALVDACEQAHSEGRLVVVTGVAGMGKTSLLRVAQELAGQAGLRTLTARGGELERNLGFSLVRQLFDTVLRGTTEAQQNDLFSGMASLARIVLRVDSAAEQPNPSDDLRVLYGLYWLVANLSQSTPLALVLDDLQWADPASLRFLNFLLHRMSDLPLLVVGAWRPEAAGTPPPLLAAYSNESNTLVLSPGSLSQVGVEQLIRRRFDTPEPEKLARQCQTLTGGIPLYVDAVLRQISRTGELDLSDLEWDGPDPLVGSVLGRLRALGADCGAIAEAAAVLGDACTLARAARLAGVGDSDAARAAVALADAGFCHHRTSPAFAHPLVQQIVYRHSSALGPGRHSAAAAMLRDEEAPIEQIAVQLLFGPGVEQAWETDVLIAAAASAMERGAPESAAVFLTRGLTRSDLPEWQRADLLLALGAAEGRAASPLAIEHLQQARVLAVDPEVRVRAALSEARILYLMGRASEAAAVLGEQVRTERNTSGRETLLEELRTLADLDLSVRNMALAAAGEPSSSERNLLGGARASAHAAVAAMMSATSADQTATLARRALASDELLRACRTGDQLFFITVFAATCADAFDISETALHQAATDAQRDGDAPRFALAEIQSGLLHARQGNLIAAAEDAGVLMELARFNGWEPLSQMALTVLTYIAVETDLTDSLLARADFGGDSLDRAELTTQSTVLLEARGHFRLATDDFAGAAADFQRVGQVLLEWGVVNPAPFPWRSAAAVALSRSGHTGRASDLADEELELSRRWGAPRALSIALRSSARHGDPARRLELLEEALSVTDGAGALLERAHALVDFGAALRRANRRADARPYLNEGLAMARRCGATVLARQAHTELWATGARPRTAVRFGAQALTPSERRVLALARDGVTNPGIAQSLFVSTKTVEMHLTSAFRKLGIKSRAEIGDALPEDESESDH